MGKRKAFRKGQAAALASVLLGAVTLMAGCGSTGAPPAGGNSAGPSAGNQTGASSPGNDTAANQTGSGGAGAGSAAGGGERGGSAAGSNQAGTGVNRTGQSAPPGGGGSFSEVAVGEARVRVPAGWTGTRLGGGDWSGWRYHNPAHPNQEVVVVFSGCVGCYMDAQGNPNPRQVIPASNASVVETLNHGLSVRYRVPPGKNPYEGAGMVTITQDMSGYGYVEVYLPADKSALAAQILDSFTVGGAADTGAP
ncbi:MAG: hypothetical protein IRZ33_08400 [Alicyclobacillaceae bacterium]|nr:hypothetical protein [Alicyclobacillaceae bacterium]